MDEIYRYKLHVYAESIHHYDILSAETFNNVLEVWILLTSARNLTVPESAVVSLASSAL